ncbi:MAG: cation:proton antiporter [Gemmatimonadaceae bacterium]
MPHGLLTDIGVAVVAATAFAMVARFLGQPLLLGYIAAGVLVGPTEGFGWISPENITPISELGLILLLFMVGLEIDLRKLRAAGSAVATAGVGQFALSVAMGMLVIPLLAPTLVAGYGGLYLAVSCAISSTMIVVKLLYDKSELEGLPGRLTLGILVFQDIWAILFLALQPELATPSLGVLVLQLVKGTTVVVAALAASRFVLPVLFRSMSTRPELLVLGALAWCFTLVLASAALGLSKEMGALVAGVALSTFPYSLDVTAKVVSLRDFFITLFFVALGTQIAWPDVTTVVTAALLSLFVIVSRFLTITPALLINRIGIRGSVVPAVNLSQISEFSLVICTIGVRLEHIGTAALSTIVWTLTLTSVISTYGILNNHRIYLALAPLLRRFGVRDDSTGEDPVPRHGREIMFLGFHRQASSLLHELLQRDPSLASQIAVVDFNPQTREALEARGVVWQYGDVSHLDSLQHAEVDKADVVISSIPDAVLKGIDNHRLLRTVRGMNPTARVIVTADTWALARRLDNDGAAFVFIPRLMGVQQLADVVIAAIDGDVAVPRREARAMVNGRREVLP